MDILDQSNWLALDTETTGPYLFHGCKPFLVSTCDLKGNIRCWEWPVDPFTREPKIPKRHLREIQELITKHILVFHNAKFDIRALESIGIIWPPLSFYRIHDTQLASHAANSLESHKLKDLAEKYLSISTTDEEDLIKAVHSARRVGRSSKWKLGARLNGKEAVKADYWMPKAVDQTSSVCRTYATWDVIRTIQLMQMYASVLTDENLWDSYFRELNLLPAIYRMESNGMSISQETLSTELSEYERTSSREERFCQAIAPINIRSPKQLQEILYKRFDLPVQKFTDAGQPATDEHTLRYLLAQRNGRSNRFLKHLIKYRECQSGLRYLKNYQCSQLNGVLYPSFHQTGTRTTRFSSSDPNAQNVSKSSSLPLRKIFCPRPEYHWISIDYSQLELRLFAHISNEQSLIDSFDQGYDFHSFVATKIFDKPANRITKEERRIAKNTNFSIIFGASPRKVNLTAGISDAYNLFANQFPNVKSFSEETIRLVHRKGSVPTITGYRLMVPPEDPYKGVSYRVQGSAGDIIKNAMIEIDSQIQAGDVKRCRMIAQIHDELLFEFEGEPDPSGIRLLQDIMEDAGRSLGVTTPTDAEIITTNWSEGVSI
jgi:DNA polymerase-1